MKKLLKNLGQTEKFEYSQQNSTINTKKFLNQCKIMNCSFQMNYAVISGGVLYAESSQIEMTRSLFSNNSAVSRNYLKTKRGATVAFGIGAALTVTQQSYAAINDCMFSGNLACITGGALSIDKRSKSDIMNSTFVDNSATYGGAVTAFEQSDINIINSNCTNNYAMFGSHISVGEKAILRIERSIIIITFAAYSSGAGIHLINNSFASFVHCNFSHGNHVLDSGFLSAQNNSTIRIVSSEFKETSGLNLVLIADNNVEVNFTNCTFLTHVGFQFS